MAGGRSASPRTRSRSARSGASCTTACSRWPATSTRCAAASRRAVDAYNKSVGSLESRVLPAARKFKELGAAPGAEIDELRPVQTAARTLQSPDLAPLLEHRRGRDRWTPWPCRPMWLSPAAATMAAAGERVSGDLRAAALHRAPWRCRRARSENPMRPLSSRGQQQVQELRSEAAARDAKPHIIWHSGKLRARQTAEAYWRACNPLAQFAAVTRAAAGRSASVDRRPPACGRRRDDGGRPHAAPAAAAAPAAGGRCGRVQRSSSRVNGVVCLEEQAGAWAERWRIRRRPGDAGARLAHAM